MAYGKITGDHFRVVRDPDNEQDAEMLNLKANGAYNYHGLKF
jgi:hypothetical protein